MKRLRPRLQSIALLLSAGLVAAGWGIPPAHTAKPSPGGARLRADHSKSSADRLTLLPHGFVILPPDVRTSMNELFLKNNQHWDELVGLTTLEQMLGTIKPTQREYLGCLQGRVAGDTVHVSGWSEARNLKQLQFAVDGSCDHVPAFIGTWHTHPYRADLANLPLKERALSPMDLATFEAGTDLVTLAVWDVDSADAALRRPAGGIFHPARVEVSLARNGEASKSP